MSNNNGTFAAYCFHLLSNSFKYFFYQVVDEFKDNFNKTLKTTRRATCTTRCNQSEYTDKGQYILPSVVEYNNIYANDDGMASVHYQYNDERKDQLQQADAGLLKTMSHRLSGVDIKVNDILHSSYAFTYSPQYHYSRLIAVSKTSYPDGYSSSAVSQTLKVYDWFSDKPQSSSGSGEIVLLNGTPGGPAMPGDAGGPDPTEDKPNDHEPKYKEERDKLVSASTAPAPILPSYDFNKRNGSALVKYGDFNGDGITDIYKINDGQDTISLLQVTTGSDGKTSLSVKNTLSSNLPAGRLTSSTTGDNLCDFLETYCLENIEMKRSRLSQRVIIGDYNGDGFDDIYYLAPLISNNTENDVIYLSDGKGNFKTLELSDSLRKLWIDAYPEADQGQRRVNGRAMSMIHAGDFDGDQKTDLIMFFTNHVRYPDGAAFHNKFAVLRNGGEYGSGKFSFTRTVASGSDPEIGNYGDYYHQGHDAYKSFDNTLAAIKLGDFNGDGLTDVYWAYTDNNANHLLMLAKGDGHFRARTGLSHHVNYHRPGNEDESQSAGRFIPGDFNGDGVTDLMSVQQVNSSSYFCPIFFTQAGNAVSNDYNSSDCNNKSFEFTELYNVALNRIKVGDFNGDGLDDLMVIFGDHAVDDNGDGEKTPVMDDYIWLSNGSDATKTWLGMTLPAASLDEYTGAARFNISTRSCTEYGGADSTVVKCEALGVHLSRHRFVDFDGDGITDRHYINDDDADANLLLSRAPTTSRILAVVDVPTATTSKVTYAWSLDSAEFPEYILNKSSMTPNYGSYLVKQLETSTKNSEYSLKKTFDYRGALILRGNARERRDLGVGSYSEYIYVNNDTDALNKTQTWFYQSKRGHHRPYKQSVWSNDELKSEQTWYNTELVYNSQSDVADEILVGEGIELVYNHQSVTKVYPLGRGLKLGSETASFKNQENRHALMSDSCPEGTLYHNGACRGADELCQPGQILDTNLRQCLDVDPEPEATNEYVEYKITRSDYDGYGLPGTIVSCVAGECKTSSVTYNHSANESSFSNFATPFGITTGRQVSEEKADGTNNLLSAEKWQLNDKQLVEKEEYYVCADAAACSLAEHSYNGYSGWRTRFSGAKYDDLGRLKEMLPNGDIDERTTMNYLTTLGDLSTREQWVQENAVKQGLFTIWSEQYYNRVGNTAGTLSLQGITESVAYGKDGQGNLVITNTKDQNVSQITYYTYDVTGHDYADLTFTGQLGEKNCIYLKGDEDDTSKQTCTESRSNGFGLTLWSKRKAFNEGTSPVDMYVYSNSKFSGRNKVNSTSSLTTTAPAEPFVFQTPDANWTKKTLRGEDYQAEIITPGGGKTVYSRQDSGLYDRMSLKVTQTVDSDNISEVETTYYYDEKDRIEEVVDANGKSIYYFYDTMDRLVCVKTNAQSRGEVCSEDNRDVSADTVMQYNSFGEKTAIITPEMGKKIYQYNSKGQLVKELFAADLSSQIIYTYNNLGRLATTSTSGYLYENIYDMTNYGGESNTAKGKLLATRVLENGNELETRYFKYDSRSGYLTTEGVISPAGIWEMHYGDYDRLGNPTEVTLPDGTVKAYDIDGDTGLINSITLKNDYDEQDASLLVSYSGYNKYGQPKQRLLGHGTYAPVVTDYSYDSATYFLDTLKSSANRESLQNYSYTFDKVGNVLSIADGNYDTGIDIGAADNFTLVNQGRSFSYDKLHRLKSWTQTQADITTNYDYDHLGNITEKYHSASSGALTQKFDYSERYTEGLRKISGYTGASKDDGSGNYSAVFDEFGRMSNRTLNGSSWNYEYSFVNNQLTGVRQGNNLLASFVYDASERRISKTEEGVTTYYVFPEFEVEVHTPESAAKLQGLISPLNRAIDAADSQTQGVNTKTTLYRLNIQGGGAERIASYQDAFTGSEYYGTVWSNALKNTGEVVDENGNDIARHCYSVIKNGDGRYSDYFIYVDVGGIDVPIKLDYIVESEAGNDNVAIHCDEVASSSEHSLDNELAVKYFLQDHIGSTSAVLDRYGRLVSYLSYTPFGEVVGSQSIGNSHAKLQFTGQERDESIGLNYYGARHYDPFAGRFTTADSLVPNPYDLQSYNRYAYVLNNPVKYVDPTGHVPHWKNDEEGINNDDQERIRRRQEIIRQYNMEKEGLYGMADDGVNTVKLGITGGYHINGKGGHNGTSGIFAGKEEDPVPQCGEYDFGIFGEPGETTPWNLDINIITMPKTFSEVFDFLGSISFGGFVGVYSAPANKLNQQNTTGYTPQGSDATVGTNGVGEIDSFEYSEAFPLPSKLNKFLNKFRKQPTNGKTLDPLTTSAGAAGSNKGTSTFNRFSFQSHCKPAVRTFNQYIENFVNDQIKRFSRPNASRRVY